ncbi:MAG: sulfur-oxidizing protein SoxX [Paracoccaceae bacterium]|jgi:sulfur-oxidizing protein SoxX
MMSSTRIIAAIAATSLIVGVASAETLSPDQVKFADGAVAQSLTGAAGDPVAGRELFANRKLGNCLACHQNPEMPEQAFQGETGPTLEGVAGRYDETHLRGLVVNSKMTFEDTMMPSFYRSSGFYRVAGKFADKTILSAQQVEDVVAYLKTLKDE